MTTFGISMVKDELDVIEGTLRHMADEVDWLFVADNASTDGTRDLLDKLTDDLPLTVYSDPALPYRQSEKMSALAARAASGNPVWIVPFDADELWVGSHRIRDLLDDRPENVVTARLFNHFPSAVDPPDPDPFRSIIWRQPDPAPLPKVAFRWEPDAVIHQGNHDVTLPSGGPRVPLLEVRHFPYRSAGQFVSKARNGAAAYAATDLPEHVGAHWRSYGQILDRYGEEALQDVFRTHFWALSPIDRGWIPDPAPYLRWR